MFFHYGHGFFIYTHWIAFIFFANRRQVGLAGFCPFDLMAAAYPRDPSTFRCAPVIARISDDPLLPWFGGGLALPVSQDTPPPSADGVGTALFCDRVRLRLGSLFE